MPLATPKTASSTIFFCTNNVEQTIETKTKLAIDVDDIVMLAVDGMHMCLGQLVTFNP